MKSKEFWKKYSALEVKIRETIKEKMRGRDTKLIKFEDRSICVTASDDETFYGIKNDKDGNVIVILDHYTRPRPQYAIDNELFQLSDYIHILEQIENL